MSQISIVSHSYLYLILINIETKDAIKEMSVLKVNHVKIF